MKLIGPFTQMLTMDHLPAKGSIADRQLEIMTNAGVLVNDEGKLVETGEFSNMENVAIRNGYNVERIEEQLVVLPGFIDAHTHLCWAGSRAGDYAMRLAGFSYLDIAKAGGGIWSTVQHTRAASLESLCTDLEHRASIVLAGGVTTCEVKSGYGLQFEAELKMLKAIKKAHTITELVPTCLAAHLCPKDFEGSPVEYLQRIVKELLPVVKDENLSKRVDIFVEEGAFAAEEARTYLQQAKALGFDLIIHGDQFSLGGSQLAIEMKAQSVDHLEASDSAAIEQLAASDVVATVLPGASLGLGLPFAPARKLLDRGACLAIASDWNPGSAPNGMLLMQAAVLGAYEKLSMAETLAGITSRAAKALNLNDRGILRKGMLADMVAFPTADYREILYQQGSLKPVKVWKKASPFNNLTKF